jgi:hypothetical protein
VNPDETKDRTLVAWLPEQALPTGAFCKIGSYTRVTVSRVFYIRAETFGIHFLVK